jgi:rfaE bifunctional protein kinase chain/domain
MIDIFEKLSRQNVMIVGDFMIDRYLHGGVHRISPEAPVPVFLHKSTENRLGGAGNVALNIQALGAQPILAGAVGHDEDGDIAQQLLGSYNLSTAAIFRSDCRCTTVKTRIIGNHQQMLRIDKEDIIDFNQKEHQRFLEKVTSVLDNQAIDVILFQDYNKGVLTVDIIEAVTKLAHEKGIKTTVDPKKKNFFAYHGADLFKPNLKEVRESVPFEVSPNIDSLQNAANYIRSQIGQKRTMITLSERGLFLEENGKGAIYPIKPRNIADVSGAGDSVISIASLGLAARLDLEQIARLSNMAGGQVCEYPGVVPVQLDQLKEEYYSG